jgi:predicted phage terminase large subunit-like protein
VTKKDTLTAQHIEGFVNLFLRNRFDVPTEIPDCHREWWELCCSKHPFVAIAAPRGHAKSTAITHSYALANIVMRQRNFILIVSDTEQQASYFLNDIKRELIDNEDLMKVFGVSKLLKDAETDMIIEFDDGHQCRVIAKGSEQKLRGIKWDNKRPDLIICDDLENDEIVMNDDRRRKFRNWFSGALLPCRSVNGIIRYVGTILHMDSMLQRLMPKESDKRCSTTPLSIKSPVGSPWSSILYRAHTRNFDHILWPERWPEVKLKSEREHYLSQGQGDKYAQEYLNTPIDEANAFFRKSDMPAMSEKDYKTTKTYYVGVDLAFTLAQAADHTCFIVGGVDEEGYLNVVEVIRERMDSVDSVATILALNKKYNPQYFFFEKGALTNSVLPHLHVAMQENNNYLSYEMFARIVDKVQFAQTIRARMRLQRVRFDKKAEWYGDLEQELLRFPRDASDDQVDSLAILGRGVEKFIDAPTQKEQEDEAYMEAFQISGLNHEGRNEITGY